MQAKKKTLQELFDVISSNMTKQTNGIFIVAGDFNQTNLRTVLPKFYQHVQILTRGRIILDHVQCIKMFLAAAKPSHIRNLVFQVIFICLFLPTSSVDKNSQTII